MKNVNIFGVHREIWFLGGVHKKPIYRRECLKMGRRGAWQKRSGGVFVGGLIPQCTLCLIVSLFFSSVLFLSSKPFWNNLMHCEIIDCYFNIVFVEIQLKKENLKSVFGHFLEFGGPNLYTGLPNNQNTQPVIIIFTTCIIVDYFWKIN